jgi:hypothetical protein
VDETAIKGIAGFIQKRFDLIKDSVLLIAAALYQHSSRCWSDCGVVIY